MAAAAPRVMEMLLRRPLHLLTVIFHPVHLRRTATIAVAVGTWLTLVNEGDVLIGGHWSATLLTKSALNYLTPFVVSNLGLLSRTFHEPAADAAPHI